MSSNTATRSKFADFRAKKLLSPVVKAAYEDSRARNIVLDALVRRRRALGLKQMDLARAMDVAQSTLSGFETEGSDPRLSTLQRYARAVNATLYLHVIPNMPGGQRPAVYVSYPTALETVVEHSEATDRARLWAESQSPYGGRSHLSLVS